MRRRATAVALALLLTALLTPVARAAPPSLRAHSAILVETSTGDVLFARRAGEPRPVASTTKLMTALLALERKRLTDRITSPGYRGLSVESTIGLQRGERMTVADLLTGLLLASGNDAAQTIAKGVAGSVPAFVRLMNRRASRLRLTDTRYDNPIGLDGSENHSSAADLVKLTLELRRYPFFRATTDKPTARLTSGRKIRVVRNRNLLVGRYPEVNGVKTGHTRGAGYVLVGSATRGGVSVISAVLGDPSEGARDGDTLALLRYGLRSYRRARLLAARRSYAELGARGSEKKVPLLAGRSYDRVVRRGQRPRVRFDTPRELEGPLPPGARVGTAIVSVGPRVVARIPLVTGATVPEPSATSRISDWLSGAATLALGAVLLAMIAIILLSRRRANRRRRHDQAGSGIA